MAQGCLNNEHCLEWKDTAWSQREESTGHRAAGHHVFLFQCVNGFNAQVLLQHRVLPDGMCMAFSKFPMHLS